MSHTANRQFPTSYRTADAVQPTTSAEAAAAEAARQKRCSEAPIQNKCSAGEALDFPSDPSVKVFLYFAALTLSSAVVGQGLVWFLNRVFN
jgi:hypothetical protein